MSSVLPQEHTFSFALGGADERVKLWEIVEELAGSSGATASKLKPSSQIAQAPVEVVK